MQQLLDDFSPHDASARLWPQTERLKAAALAARMTGDDATARSRPPPRKRCCGISPPPFAGLWYDRIDAEGNVRPRAGAGEQLLSHRCGGGGAQRFAGRDGADSERSRTRCGHRRNARAFRHGRARHEGREPRPAVQRPRFLLARRCAEPISQHDARRSDRIFARPRSRWRRASTAITSTSPTIRGRSRSHRCATVTASSARWCSTILRRSAMRCRRSMRAKCA